MAYSLSDLKVTLTLAGNSPPVSSVHRMAVASAVELVGLPAPSQQACRESHLTGPYASLPHEGVALSG